jgi:hypothetical protein
MEESEQSVTFKKDEFQVAYEQFVRFLDGVKMSMICPNCGTEGNWTLFTGSSNEGDAEYLTAYKMPIAGTTFYRVHFSMSCGNCGGLRSIYARRVLDWLEANPELPE